MRSVLEPQREVPLRGTYDVVVAGAGTAGITAAIAAARNGAKVLLLERGGFLGGHIATQLLEHSAGWFDATGQKIVGGIPDELVDRVVQQGASAGHVRDDTGYTLYRFPVSHEEFKSVVTGWIDEAGVDILTQSPVVAVIPGEQGRTVLIVENKSGRVAYETSTVVDTTGDADVCALAGGQFLNEPGAATQPVSMLFKIAGIDHETLLDYVSANPGEFKMGVKPEELRGEDYVNLWGFKSLLEKAYDDGVLSLARSELHYSGWTKTGEAVINATRCAADATNAEDIARAEVILRKQVLEFLAFFRRYVPGCSNAFLSATAACVGVRESRRIVGLTLLADADVRAGRDFPDAVARGGFPIDSHDPKGKGLDATEHVPTGYDIPLGCLLPEGLPSIIVAGRCISAERRALASARITGTCMAMGQAAGTAAALAAKQGRSLHQIDVSELQGVLREQGAIFVGGSD
jgi:hypothetical protein